MPILNVIKTSIELSKFNVKKFHFLVKKIQKKHKEIRESFTKN